MKKLGLINLLICLLLFSCEDNTAPVLEEHPADLTPVKAVESIKLFDINNRNNASDIRMFFTYPLDERGTSIRNLEEFRVIIVPTIEKESLVIDDFTTHAQPLIRNFDEEGLLKVTLSDSLMDYSGNELAIGEPYHIAVASIHRNDIQLSQVTVSDEPIILLEEELQDLYITDQGYRNIMIVDLQSFELNDLILLENHVSHPQYLMGNAAKNALLVSGVKYNTAPGDRIISDPTIYSVTLKESDSNHAFEVSSSSQFLKLDPEKYHFTYNPTLGPENELYITASTIEDGEYNTIFRVDYNTGIVKGTFLSDINPVSSVNWQSDGTVFLKHNEEAANDGTIRKRLSKFSKNGGLIFSLGKENPEPDEVGLGRLRNFWVINDVIYAVNRILEGNQDQTKGAIGPQYDIIEKYDAKTGDFLGTWADQLTDKKIRMPDRFFLPSPDGKTVFIWAPPQNGWASFLQELDLETGETIRSLYLPLARCSGAIAPGLFGPNIDPFGF